MKITRKQLKTLIEHAINEAKSTHVTIEIKGIDYSVEYQYNNDDIDVMRVTQDGRDEPKCHTWYVPFNRNAIKKELQRKHNVKPQPGGKYTFKYDWKKKPKFFGCDRS